MQKCSLGFFVFFLLLVFNLHSRHGYLVCIELRRAAASEPPELRVSVAEALSLVLTAYSSPNVKVTVISRIKSLVLSFAFEVW